jgi:hypothetical protein
MRFKTKYPKSKVGDAPEPDVFHSGRVFACDFQMCKSPTPWRMIVEVTGHHMPCCSEDCKEELTQQYLENP